MVKEEEVVGSCDHEGILEGPTDPEQCRGNGGERRPEAGRVAVRVQTTEGTLKRRWGNRGEEPAQLSLPVRAASSFLCHHCLSPSSGY